MKIILTISLTLAIGYAIVTCSTPTPRKAIAQCRMPDVWDLGEPDWYPEDEQVIQSRIAYCAKYEYNPCLVKLVRWKRGQYTFRCGPKEIIWVDKGPE